MQFAAWALQLVSCYTLMVALGLDHQGADLGAAAAVLFAVNVSAVLPVTPSNVGVFQAACMAVLIGAYGIGAADALGYGIILQAVEGRDGGRAGRAGAGQGGPLLARGQVARNAHGSG
jgi:phosphatidylinositol alpha-mannosyltransferase